MLHVPGGARLRRGVAPYGALRRSWERARFAAVDARRIRSLRGIHAGERCFVIGNGPSLAAMDLTPLARERTFVSNMFANHPDLEALSPTYYCISDWVHWSSGRGFTENLKDAFRRLSSTTFLFEYDAKRVVDHTPELDKREVHYFFQAADEPVWEGHFQADATRPLHWGRTVMIDACLPLAIHMGFREIILIGNDFNWNVDKQPDLASAYFYAADKDDRGLTRSAAHAHTGQPEHVALAMSAFEVVRERAEAVGVRILNAGIGGKLEVFPRVDYKSLF